MIDAVIILSTLAALAAIGLAWQGRTILRLRAQKKEDIMASLDNLTAAITALVPAAKAVEDALTAAKSGNVDQAAIDALTTQVQAVTAQLNAAVAPPAPAPAPAAT